MKHELLTVDEVAQVLRVHTHTVYRWIKAGCPCVTMPGSYRLKMIDVVKWLEKKGNKKYGR